MKKILSWILGAVIVAGIVYAAQTTVNTSSDTFETAWDRQHAMNTELYGYETSEQTWRSSVTQTEMGYVDGVTSDIQTQLNAKETADAAIVKSDEAETISSLWSFTSGLKSGPATVPTLYFEDSGMPGADLGMGLIYANYTTGVDGNENSDMMFSAMQDGAEKIFMAFDESDDEVDLTNVNIGGYLIASGTITCNSLTVESNTVDLGDVTEDYVLTFNASTNTWAGEAASGGSVSDTVYGSDWNGDTTTAASKNAIYDKIETLAGGHDAVTLGTARGLSLSTQELSMAAASTSAVGTVELATGAETVTGTDATRAVTPDGLTDKMAAPGAIGGTTPAAGAFTTMACTDFDPTGAVDLTNASSVSLGVLTFDDEILGLRTGTSAADFFEFGAYDVDGTAYEGLMRFVAGDTIYGYLGDNQTNAWRWDESGNLTFQGTADIDLPANSVDTADVGDNQITAAKIVDMYAYQEIPVGWMQDGTSAPDALDDASTRSPYAYRTFAHDADEDLNFVWIVPADLSGSTIQFRVYYLVTNATGPSSEGVAFGLSGVSLGDNDATNGAKGTVVVITDPTITAAQHDVLITGWSGDVTVTNIAAGEVAELALIRDVSDAADDYAQVVGVFMIQIRYVQNPAR